MAFFVGQKVVCVDDATAPGSYVWWPGTKPALGAIYTVRAIGQSRRGLGLRLVELSLDLPEQNLDDLFYFAGRFRPVVERKTDISTLTALLNPANHKHLEGV